MNGNQQQEKPPEKPSVAKEVAVGVAKKGIKAGAKRVGLKLAAKLGLKAAFAGLSGGTSLLLTEVAPRLLKGIKKGLTKIHDFIFGKRDKRESTAILGGLTFLGGVLLSSMPLMVIGGITGVGAVISLVGAAALGTSVASFFTAVALVITSSVAAVSSWLIVAIITIPFLIAFILFIINAGAYVVPRSPVGDISFVGIPADCTTEKLPVSFSNATTSSIASRAWEITADLYQGFWCFWNRSPDDFPGDVVLYPPSYPQLFNETLFAQNPFPTRNEVANDASNLFWCTQLVVISYQETGTPIAVVYRSDLMKNDFINRGKFTPSYSATPSNVPPGSVVFFRVQSGPPRTNHVGIVHHIVGIDAINYVQSNAPAKEGALTFDSDGVGVQDLPGIIVEGFGTP